ncbi:sulfur relay protein DsrC [Vulcanibacillus modesticaldus]|uniref:Sulfur relay protein DsrC n=1 Tax=Vulcanibacillus modesticaldus TaxID=337097 RepID=A0A1D2YW45_9BACI|nr:TusE/DsrC/DsvC family sulfur relay protein [Vulcanibacillus modesticaldus]OEF99922.1 sulfur relay protein DsrC [Vulcanibacillus modesticaldus]
MTEKMLADFTVNVNEEGYLTDPSQWNKEIAVALAKEVGIEELTEAHWKVIEFLQKEVKENGKLPTIRRINKVGGIPTKELYQLFPDGPLAKAAKIAGLSKPASCI